MTDNAESPGLMLPGCCRISGVCVHGVSYVVFRYNPHMGIVKIKTLHHKIRELLLVINLVFNIFPNSNFEIC